MGPPGRERASAGRVPPGWDGRAPGGRGPGGPNGPGGPDRRSGSGRGPGDGPPTRQLPAQPREARGRHNPRRAPRPARWGGLQGGLGVCIIVASAAGGTIATMVTRNAPGFLLGLCVVAGTVIAALAVRPRAGRLIFPVPVLSYLVGALVSGYVYDRSTGTSRTALAIGAAQWIADGFFAMALATVLAVVITTIRWILWRRRRPVARDPDWPTVSGPEPGYPARPGPPRGPRAPEGPRTPRGPGGQGAWNDADPHGGARRPAPRPGTGPYNFSSGA